MPGAVRAWAGPSWEGVAAARRMPAVTAKAISGAPEAGLGGSEVIFEVNAGPPKIALQRPRYARG